VTRSVEDCKRRALALASKLGVEIPGDSPSTFWMLPILEALAARIESGEKTPVQHHELCDVLDVNAEGIKKPCNCGAVTRPAPP
jgi:hypothetical protein